WRGRPQAAGADRDRRGAGRAVLLVGVLELGQGLGQLDDARGLEEVVVVPEALDAEGVGDGVLLAVDLPRLHGSAVLGDGVGHHVGEVHEVAGVGLRANLAAGPHHEDVGRVAGLERVRDERALQVLVLVAGDLDLDAGVVLLELRSDVFPHALLRVGRRVVPPGDGDGAVVVASAAGAAGGETADGQSGCRGDRSDPDDPGSVHLRTPLESFDNYVESGWDAAIIRRCRNWGQ